MAVYSHSRLSTFEQCPLKYRLKYIERKKPDIRRFIEGFLGGKVHDTLEWVYNSEEKIELDDVIGHFIRNWNRDFNDDIRIVKEELDNEYYFNLGIRFLINYYKENFPFKDNTIETEKEIFVSLDEKGRYRLKGYIDRLVHHKDTNVFEIHDYKTNGNMKEQEELDRDRQLGLYCIGIRDLFREAKEVLLVWHFLAFGEKRVSKRDEEQLEALKKEIIELIKKIESAKEFPPSLGCLCKWCEYQISCPYFEKNNS